MAPKLLATLAASAAAVLVAGSTPAWAAWDDMSLGPRDAKITVIEYASTTCPHCAHWDEEVFPAFRKKYIDTGKVHYILREFPTDPARLSVAGFLVARCAGPKYFTVLDTLWRSQEELFKTQDAKAWLVGAGKAADLTPEKVQACVEDAKALKDFETRLQENVKALNVEGTPTFFVNGKIVGEGGPSLEDLDKAIAGAEADLKAPADLKKKR
jgi:protein-disulfide isomerase